MSVQELLATLRALGPADSMQIAVSADQHELLNDPNTAPAGTHAMQYHGGAVLPDPKLVLLWCGHGFSRRADVEHFAQELMELGYLSALSYAGFRTGRFLGSFDGPTPTADLLLDSQIQEMLTQFLVQNPHIPQPDGGTIYSMMLAPGVVVQFDGSNERSCSHFCGYHSAIGRQLLYTVQPDTACSGCNQGDPFVGLAMVLAHEVAETQSDPYGDAWYENSTGMENADIVAWVPQPYGPWTVQGYADPNGNNVLGSYTPRTQPQPDPVAVFWARWGPYGDGVAAQKSVAKLDAQVALGSQWSTYLHSLGRIEPLQDQVLVAKERADTARLAADEAKQTADDASKAAESAEHELSLLTTQLDDMETQFSSSPPPAPED